MKISQILNKEHLYRIQHTRCYEFYISLEKARKLDKDFKVKIIWDLETIQHLASEDFINNFTFKKCLDSYPNLVQKADRMLDAKRKYEQAGGQYY